MAPEIYADFNGYRRGEGVDWVELDTFGTLQELHFQQVILREGLEIIAWDQSDESEDVEVIGTSHYHAGVRPHWCVHFPHGTLHYVPRRHALTPDFLCFRCRQIFPDSVRQAQQGSCPTCGLSIQFPWSAPLSTP